MRFQNAHMETYGRVLMYAIPVFLLLVVFEKWYGWKKGKDTVVVMDMVSSLMSGITNVTKDVLGLSVAIISYGWLVKHLAITHIENNIAVILISFIALDFSGYWIHRIQHTTNIFWNAHIVHHSSEEFNLACALRQSISVFFRIFTFFLLPAALLGVPAQVIAVVAPLHLFMQFWYHTQHIDRMGFLEKIIVTPSHHRVHHAINPEYIDKNYSQIFIFWDRLFGTFQEEKKEITPVYGITRPASTWNPIKINFQHLGLLMKDAWHTNKWSDKLKIWFMPTGWRPADVEEKFPVYKISDVYHFNKFNPTHNNALEKWSVFQLVLMLPYLFYLFGNIASIGSPGIFYYGLFIFLSVYSLTELMDGNKYAIVWEIIKTAYVIWLIVDQKGWFGAEKVSTLIPAIILSLQLLGIASAVYFSKNKTKTAVN